MIRADHPFLRFGESLFTHQPFRLAKGLVSAYLAYPIAERMEKREVSSKLLELRKHYQIPLNQRLVLAKQRLVNILSYAQDHVPYYRDLFIQHQFDPQTVFKDMRYFEDLPYLTKEIIREQGDRLLSVPLADIRHHVCKTGGSTGSSVIIYYDQVAADYSAAVTLFCREQIGKSKYKSELHFACRFPDQQIQMWPSREDYKCFAMNRSNIFFDRIDDLGLEEIWCELRRLKPYLVHGHPSTLYALACYVERQYGSIHIFDMFESSGELLEPYMREKIAKVFQCDVINRYGLAEFGVRAYELSKQAGDLELLDSEGLAETRELEDGSELVLTGFRNHLMPLIRYTTGDCARVAQKSDTLVLTEMVGRIHDIVHINGVAYATHHLMDILDHRVGGIQEFQIDMRSAKPILRIVLNSGADPGVIRARVENYFPQIFHVEIVDSSELIYVGHRAKFRHVVSA